MKKVLFVSFKRIDAFGASTESNNGMFQTEFFLPIVCSKFSLHKSLIDNVNDNSFWTSKTLHKRGRWSISCQLTICQ